MKYPGKYIKKKRCLVTVILFIAAAFTANAQNSDVVTSGTYLSRSWKYIASNMPWEWYGSDEAKSVAQILLLTQKDIGGWDKNKNFHRLSKGEIAALAESRAETGATFDNNATITELRFLAKVFSHHQDKRYKDAFEKGLNYIFLSQYDNGGWPQFYPARRGVSYSSHITYNDNAMVNILLFLRDIYADKELYTLMNLSEEVKLKAKKAFDNGIECILNTQIVVDGKPTVWCAQHDEKTLAPAAARAYELPSFSGSESAGIVLLLMDIEKPSGKMINAVEGAVNWFKSHKLEGIRLERAINEDGKRDLIVVQDEKAAPLWARFYDLKTEKPYFCGRDGIKRTSISEIEYERRNGYGWYTDAPKKVLEKYSEWLQKKEIALEMR